MCRSVESVPRSLARFHAIAAAAQIERNALHAAEQSAPLPRSAREASDRRQLIGVPVFVIKPPAWRRQDWAEPQRPPTRPRRG